MEPRKSQGSEDMKRQGIRGFYLKLSLLWLLLTVLSACGGGGGVTSSPPVVPPPDLSLPLPYGHGIRPGRITVEPGVSDEHGNMVLSCPSGGPACVVTVASDGTATYDRTGGAPTVTAWGYFRNNIFAEDLLDHWNDPQTLRSALGLSVVNQSDIVQRKRVLKVLLDSADGNPENAGARFRNVRPEDVEVIGERNGITYGQWKSGPAGTLNIEFEYRGNSAAVFDSSIRAAIERAGKAWSYHINDYGSYTIQNISLDDQVFKELTIDGLYVSVGFEEEGCGGAAACAGGLVASRDSRARIGTITFTRRVAGFPGNPGGWSSDWDRQMGTAAHELGHVLWAFEGFQRHINTVNGTFDGPKAREANGGNSVPFRRYLEGDFWVNVPAGTPGAIVDYAHPGGCVGSIMTYYAPYCGDGVGADGTWSNGPSELDKAILADSGYQVLDSKTASEPEIYGFGAWGRYSAFGVGVSRALRFAGDFVFHNTPNYEWDSLWAGADAFGVAPGANLAQNPALKETVSWSGSLLGVDLGQAMLPPVFGDAELQVTLSNLNGTARFDNLRVFVENKPTPFRAPSLAYAIQVTGNAFSDTDNRINGGFFGPAHEEMAGVLDDRTPRVNLLGGFGGKR